MQDMTGSDKKRKMIKDSALSSNNTFFPLTKKNRQVDRIKQ